MLRWKRPPGWVFALFVFALMLNGCAEKKAPPTSPYGIGEGPASGVGPYKIGKPYQIGGVWYYPSEDYAYDETGVASWYGPDFHGKYTANGEVFDQDAVTAAHRTLPMPCIVRVTNLDNGRSVVVRVNDRGPFAHGRILDLSRRAAQLLGMELEGTARVRVQILADESRALAYQLKGGGSEVVASAAAPRVAVAAESLAPPPGKKAEPQKSTADKSLPKAVVSTPATVATIDEQHLATQDVKVVPVHPTQMYIQTGAFTHYDNAHRMSAALSAVGPASISQFSTSSGVMFRVRLGPIASLDAADAMLERVLRSGFPDARLVVD